MAVERELVESTLGVAGYREEVEAVEVARLTCSDNYSHNLGSVHNVNVVLVGNFVAHCPALHHF